MPGYWNAHSDLDWYCGSAAHEPPHEIDDDPDAPAERAEALRMAEIRLMQSLDQSRWDMAAMACVSDASDYLRACGRGDLADRLDADAWGSDCSDVLREVTAMRVGGL